MTASLDVLFISRRVDRKEQNRIYVIVRIGKSEAEVTNNKRRRSRYCTAEAK